MPREMTQEEVYEREEDRERYRLSAEREAANAEQDHINRTGDDDE